MSQNLSSLNIVAKESGTKGELLRPLSAKLLAETEAEKKGYVNREKLLDLHGKGRRRQMDLAEHFGIKEYETPAGGCLLTEKHYTKTLRDLFENSKKITINDIQLLKSGRNLRFKDIKMIVGRNEKENEQLRKLKRKTDIMFEVKNFVGPFTLLRGKYSKNDIELAASITARYSDADKNEVVVKYGQEKFNKEITINKIKAKELDKLRLI